MSHRRTSALTSRLLKISWNKSQLHLINMCRDMSRSKHTFNIYYKANSQFYILPFNSKQIRNDFNLFLVLGSQNCSNVSARFTMRTCGVHVSF